MMRGCVLKAVMTCGDAASYGWSAGRQPTRGGQTGCAGARNLLSRVAFPFSSGSAGGGVAAADGRNGCERLL